jgi:hypothetical protein
MTSGGRGPAGSKPVAPARPLKKVLQGGLGDFFIFSLKGRGAYEKIGRRFCRQGQPFLLRLVNFGFRGKKIKELDYLFMYFYRLRLSSRMIIINQRVI